MKGSCWHMHTSSYILFSDVDQKKHKTGGLKMINDKLFSDYLKEVNQHFEGWNFSYISESGRIGSGLVSWSYGSMVKPLVQNANSMLDMGTGGGELLSMLRPFPEEICATEAYKPNVP